jgi:hypothetical protein
MNRVHYRRPEDLPPHQRDFPPREAPQGIQRSGDDGSWVLALMVGAYLAAMVVAFALLVRVNPPSQQNTQTVAGRSH